MFKKSKKDDKKIISETQIEQTLNNNIKQQKNKKKPNFGIIPRTQIKQLLKNDKVIFMKEAIEFIRTRLEKMIQEEIEELINIFALNFNGKKKKLISKDLVMNYYMSIKNK